MSQHRPSGPLGSRDADHQLPEPGVLVEVERPVSHVIVLASPAQADDIVGRLQEAGFRLGTDAIEANLGIRSRTLPIAGGGFIEVSCEVSPGSFAHGAAAFTRTPRIGFVSYVTQDAAADLAHWRDRPEPVPSLAQAGSFKRQDGSLGYYTVVSPAPISFDVSFTLREVRLFPLPYADSADGAPELLRVGVRGGDAERWYERHVDLFALPGVNGQVRAGSTDVIFEQADGEETEISLQFAVENPDVSIPLSSGRFEFTHKKEAK